MKTQVDVLLVDTAAGISDMVLSFTRAAQDIMVVVCDEPTSITDAYALIKILSKDHGVFRFKGGGNMVRSPARGQGAVRQADPGHRPLPRHLLELVACVPYDTNLRAAVRKQKLIVEAFPEIPRLPGISVPWPTRWRAGRPSLNQPGDTSNFSWKTCCKAGHNTGRLP